MAESVKNKECTACGADVRPNTLFCYNCGDSFAPEVAVTVEDKKSVSEVSFQEQIGDEGKNGGKPVQVVDKPEDKPENKPENRSENEAADEIEDKVEIEEIEKVTDAQIPKPKEQKNLKSAAAMRRKSKAIKAKNTEIIWEEHNDAPNIWFLLVTIVLTIFAGIILYLALYFR